MKKNQIVQLEITGMTNEGFGVGRYENMAVFVPGAAPGDSMQVLIVKVLKNYCFGKPLQILTPSPDRITPDCAVSAQCGGCCYRHITYDAESRIKQQRVVDAMQRIGAITAPVLPVIKANAADGYRNKAQYPVGCDQFGHLFAGFYGLHSHRIVKQEACLLQPPEFGKILKACLSFLSKKGCTAYDEATGKGLVRHIYLRKADATGQIMVCLVINGTSIPDETAFAAYITKSFPAVQTVVLNCNCKKTNVILGDTCRVLSGPGFITDVICKLRIKISPLSFYQVNRDMAELLYKTAADFANPAGKTVLDLYCGAGAIGLSMAQNAKEIIGVEIVPQAVEDAKFNARENHIQNARFLCANAADAAKTLAKEGVRPNVVVLDPPRKGAAESLIETIAADFAPERVVYVSCDPATLARDLKRFADQGYQTVKIQPVDLFPRTAHVECVALLIRNKE